MRATITMLAALAALAFASGSAAQTICGDDTTLVTTNGYVDGSTSENVDVSCACAKFDSSNPDKLLMGCNGSDGEQVLLRQTSVELDSYVLCEQQGDGTWAIAWKDPATWDGTIGSWEVGTSSTGAVYEISAKCKPTEDLSDSIQAYEATKLDLGDGMKNSTGALAKNF